jgi:protein phosphatase
MNVFHREKQADSESPTVCIRSAPFAVRSFGLTDRGRERPTNEDHFVIAELTRTLYVHQSSRPQAMAQASQHRGHVFLVADGMGGHRAGEIASGLSVESVEAFLLNTLRRFSNLQAGEEQNALQELQKALLDADAFLWAETARHPEWQGMGTTLTLAFAVNWKLFIAHAGDSRAYLFSQDHLQQLTQDHTFVAELIRRGALSAEEGSRHPFRHVVTNILGGGHPGVRVEVHKLDLHPRDVMLLCSDGLTEMVSHDQIAAILRDDPDPRRACERLVAAANDAGGLDNITTIVARAEEVKNLAAESETASLATATDPQASVSGPNQ